MCTKPEAGVELSPRLGAKHWLTFMPSRRALASLLLVQPMATAW